MSENAAERGQERAGDEESQEQYKRVYGTVSHYFLRQGLDPSEVEDLVQATIIRAVHRLPSLRDESQVSSYLYAIARNVAAEHLRQKRRAEPGEEEFIGEPH